MENFPGNSRNVTGDKPEKVVEKVVVGEVVTRKRPIGKRFKEVFFGGDFKDAARFVAADVLLPAFRDLLFDAVKEGGRRIIYPLSQQSRRRPTEYRPRVQYNSPVYRGSRETRDPRDPRGGYLPDQPPHIVRQPRHEVNELILISREEAELVLERLIDIIDKYQVASVADLYDLVGLPTSYVDNKWGWSFLNNVEIRQIREGYLIDLPPVESI